MRKFLCESHAGRNLRYMAQCTAPIRGHIRGGGADCPVHGGRYGGYGYGGYDRPSYSPPAYTPPPAPKQYSSFASRSSAGGGGRRTSSSSRSRRAAVTYSAREYQILNPVREQVVRIAQTDADRRDVFLCHAWDDRQGAALEIYNLLTDLDVTVWFSENDVPLGTLLMRQIDKGLRSSRAGIVLVTPAMIRSINAEGIAERELSVLLSTGRVIPILHGVTFEELLDVSPMLASHAGINTSEYLSLGEVVTKVADTVLIDDPVEAG
jgi:hypothetical protein